MDTGEFLEKTISTLAASPDFRTTIENLARLGTSYLSEWCGVFTFENERTIRRLILMRNGNALPGSLQVEALYPLDLHSASGPAFVFRTGEHQLLSNVTDELWLNLGLKAGDL